MRYEDYPPFLRNAVDDVLYFDSEQFNKPLREMRAHPLHLCEGMAKHARGSSRLAAWDFSRGYTREVEGADFGVVIESGTVAIWYIDDLIPAKKGGPCPYALNIPAMVRRRLQHRAALNWRDADAIRDELKGARVVVEERKAGDCNNSDWRTTT